MAGSLSVVIPARNEADTIVPLLDALAAVRGNGGEVVVADGRSTDTTRERASGRCDRVIVTAPGRARQMNAGAAATTGELLWFLHADTMPPLPSVDAIEMSLSERVWGRFDVRLGGSAPALRVVEALMNRRSRWTGVATGDQGIFVRRDAFEAVGGFRDQALMEDIAFSVAARRRFGWPSCPAGPLVTSSRRWETRGIGRTIGTMWSLRLAYALGVSPDWLHERYYGRSPRGGA